MEFCTRATGDRMLCRFDGEKMVDDITTDYTKAFLKSSKSPQACVRTVANAMSEFDLVNEKKAQTAILGLNQNINR